MRRRPIASNSNLGHGRLEIESLAPRQALVGDGGVHMIAGMKELRTLHIRSWSVSDVGLEYRATMPQLQALAVHDSLAISDDGLECVGRLSGLKDLSLAQAFQVFDEGRAHLADLTNLRRLDLRPLAGPSQGNDGADPPRSGRRSDQRRGVDLSSRRCRSWRRSISWGRRLPTRASRI
ncbi:MAG: hypothetical protein AAF961_11855 [Planctomycetota bacterium]